MNINEMKRLQAEIDRRKEQALQKLLNNDQSGAKSDVEWIDSSSKLVPFLKISKIAVELMIIALVCFAVVSGLYNIRLFSSQVSLEMKTTNVSMTIAKKWTAPFSLNSEWVYINNLRDIGVPGLNISKTASPEQEAMAIDLKGNITINGITLEEDADVELFSDENTVKMSIKKTPISGEILLGKGKIIIEASDEADSVRKENVGSEMPETINFQTDKTIGNPVRFEFIPENQDDWQLRGFNVKQIGFMEESLPGSGIFESALLSAKVGFPETGYEKEFREGDRVIVKGVKECTRLEISKDEKGVKVLFEGVVSEITAGPPGFAKNLTPRLLEYLYYDQRTGILWVALFSLIAAVLRIRNILLRN